MAAAERSHPHDGQLPRYGPHWEAHAVEEHSEHDHNQWLAQVDQKVCDNRKYWQEAKRLTHVTPRRTSLQDWLDSEAAAECRLLHYWLLTGQQTTTQIELSGFRQLWGRNANQHVYEVYEDYQATVFFFSVLQ